MPLGSRPTPDRAGERTPTVAPDIPAGDRATDARACARVPVGAAIFAGSRPAGAGVRSRGERHGFAPALAAIAREKGCPARVGDGNDPSPAVHRIDAARVYRLAIERGAARRGRHDANAAVAIIVVDR